MANGCLVSHLDLPQVTCKCASFPKNFSRPCCNPSPCVAHGGLDSGISPPRAPAEVPQMQGDNWVMGETWLTLQLLNGVNYLESDGR